MVKDARRPRATWLKLDPAPRAAAKATVFFLGQALFRKHLTVPQEAGRKRRRRKMANKTSANKTSAKKARSQTEANALRDFKDQSRAYFIAKAVNREISLKFAAEMLGLTTRQIYRLIARYKEGGGEALKNKRRGKPSNNRLSDAFRNQVMDIIKNQLSYFGPQHAANELERLHGLCIRSETLRHWMIEAGLWKVHESRIGAKRRNKKKDSMPEEVDKP
jgi:transposase